MEILSCGQHNICPTTRTLLGSDISHQVPIKKLLHPVPHLASSLSQAQPDVHGKPRHSPLEAPGCAPWPASLHCSLRQTHLCWTRTLSPTPLLRSEAQSGCRKRRKFILPAPASNPRPSPRAHSPPEVGQDLLQGPQRYRAPRPGPAGFPNWLGIDPFLRAEAGAPGPTPARCQPRPPEQREASRMPRSFTHKMILCPIVLAVVQLWG